MVETEESAEAVAPLHGGGCALRRCRVLQKSVVESLGCPALEDSPKAVGDCWASYLLSGDDGQ
jgi:hypothetical protein